MKERIVFIVEKPSTLRDLAPHLIERWPGGSLYGITTLRFGLYQYRYPRGLRMIDYPFIGEPVWRPRDLELSPVWAIRGDKIKRLEEEHSEVLRKASTIVFLADPDPTGVVAFHVLLSQVLGDDAARECRPAIRLESMHAEGVRRALENIESTHDAWFASCRSAGLARRFFDYNYDVNALAFFSPVLYALNQASTGRTKSTVQSHQMSKYSLQLLYALRDHPLPEVAGSIDHHVLLSMMNWSGTGKYPPTSLGSVTSRAAIVGGLYDDGLLLKSGVSTAGRAFLDQLHPDCCDPDLPARIRRWEQAWPATRPSMERYLRTFFGKQKRFARAA